MRNLLYALVLLSSSLSFAGEGPGLNNFRIAGIMLKDSYGSSYSAIGSWNPHLYRTGNSVYGLNLGGSIFESQAQTKFLMVETTGTWKYRLSERWRSELGAGFQTLSSDIGTHLILSANALYVLNKNRFNMDDLFFGYSNFRYRNEVLHQLRLGVEFHF